jgi:tRNA(Ile)-lysidine synthase
MALAALCSRLQVLSHTPPHARTEGLPELSSLNPLKFRAFIVDHGLRAGSDAEADAVSKILQGRGSNAQVHESSSTLIIVDIETQVLKVKWPGFGNPASLPNFESLARKLRFRLLGRACSNLGIDSLLLGHHEDDQAETILMRLVNGQGTRGLVGMKSPAGIPECYGIHGVYESGGYDNTLGGTIDQGKRLFPSACSWSRSDNFTTTQLPIESGGMQSYRPFLNFSKARLIATCLAENMEWFEDHTNTEPTTTMRNAIRHMYTNHSMPAALTKPALLALSANLNDQAIYRSEIMKSWLAKCQVTHFETRTGTVQVHFANLSRFRPPLDASLIAAELLREIIRLVTPRDHVDLSSLHSAVQNTFPEISQLSEQRAQTTAFTASDVYFQPVQPTPSRAPSLKVKNQKTEWILSRQPYLSRKLPKIQLAVPAGTAGSWSRWHLYDGRYWIRAQNHSTGSLFVQPFRQEHLADIRASLKKNDGALLIRTLRRMAPGNIRWTLPTILRKEDDGKETLIALPSLGLSTPGSMLRWEIRYKKICTDLIENTD